MKKTLVLTALIVLAAVPCHADRSDDSKKVVLAVLEAYEMRDLDALDDLVAPDVRRHCAATPNFDIKSLEEFKEFLRQDLATCPDGTQEIDIVFAADDMVAVRAIYHGTQTGPMGPFPASGKKMTLPYIGMMRVSQGKVVEIWVEWDNVTALTQLGHLPPPPGAPGAPDAPDAPDAPGRPGAVIIGD